MFQHQPRLGRGKRQKRKWERSERDLAGTGAWAPRGRWFEGRLGREKEEVTEGHSQCLASSSGSRGMEAVEQESACTRF